MLSPTPPSRNTMCIDAADAFQWKAYSDVELEDGTRELRNYYNVKPNRRRRCLLVLRHGLDLADITGQVVYIKVGEAYGSPGTSNANDVGQQHVKITVLALADHKTTQTQSLATFLDAKAPLSEGPAAVWQRRPSHMERA